MRVPLDAAVVRNAARRPRPSSAGAWPHSLAVLMSLPRCLTEIARTDVCNRALSSEQVDPDVIRERTPCARFGATAPQRRRRKHLRGVSRPHKFVHAQLFEHIALLTTCR